MFFKKFSLCECPKGASSFLANLKKKHANQTTYQNLISNRQALTRFLDSIVFCVNSMKEEESLFNSDNEEHEEKTACVFFIVSCFSSDFLRPRPNSINVAAGIDHCITRKNTQKNSFALLSRILIYR
jgi:hypothetical protein